MQRPRRPSVTATGTSASGQGRGPIPRHLLDEPTQILERLGAQLVDARHADVERGGDFGEVKLLDKEQLKHQLQPLVKLLNRAAPSAEEVHILRGIARAVQRAAAVPGAAGRRPGKDS